MKNRILSLFIVVCITSISMYGQTSQYTKKETNNSEKSVSTNQRNEIRFNLLGTVLGQVEFNYERFIEDNFGVGAVVSYNILDDYDLHSLYLVYGRLYFGNSKPCTGVYIEGNTGVTLHKSTNYNINTQTVTTTGYYPGLGLGVALGYKFLTRNNWIGELSLGVGRIYLNNTEGAYPRVGITLGKRF